jgi:hypothetical protein
MSPFVIGPMVVLHEGFFTVPALVLFVRVVRSNVVRKLGGIVEFHGAMWAYMVTDRMDSLDVFSQVHLAFEALLTDITGVGTIRIVTLHVGISVGHTLESFFTNSTDMRTIFWM